MGTISNWFEDLMGSQEDKSYMSQVSGLFPQNNTGTPDGVGPMQQPQDYGFMGGMTEGQLEGLFGGSSGNNGGSSYMTAGLSEANPRPMPQAKSESMQGLMGMATAKEPTQPKGGMPEANEYLRGLMLRGM